ncbi:DUF1513 domain-containing protein [Thalassotalea euphylliae]|uniref:DUF1513 domain-containing protein n=1 Tax=Thalassotalea euphylliae TaxID=1655234 RepID=A0A3E0U6L0_9GAMM|nr:DUF1513 domain-containing protein [Thalassotalea euphylliae]REL32193.1 DUF1513 domain-containing protein [Thalassotalea euphylliae]
MSISRRRFLSFTAKGTAAIGTCAAAVGGGLIFSQSTSAAQHWLISASTDKSGNHYAAAYRLNGELVSRVKLPARGHDIIEHPFKSGHAIVFARRPGQYFIEVDFNHGEIVKQVSPQAGSHFYGHGIGNQQVLITTENNYQQGRGAIVVRDINTYQVLEQFDSGGIGPHQLAYMPGNKHIVIANGGILTHPDLPRKKLNLDTMKPNLAYMELTSGKIVDSFELDNHQLSIRHLDVSEKGKVVAGLQYQGAKSDLVPLAIAHQGEASLQYLSASEAIWRRMNHYTASVCIDNAANLVAISCPRADMLTYWSLNDNSFIAKERFSDGAGLAMSTDGKGIIATSGKGQILPIGQANNKASSQASVFVDGIKFDNHLGYLTVS